MQTMKRATWIEGLGTTSSNYKGLRGIWKKGTKDDLSEIALLQDVWSGGWQDKKTKRQRHFLRGEGIERAK